MMRCAFCGAEGVTASRVCPDCTAERVTASRAAQGLPPTPPEAAMRLVASIAYRAGAA